MHSQEAQWILLFTARVVPSQVSRRVLAVHSPHTQADVRCALSCHRYQQIHFLNRLTLQLASLTLQHLDSYGAEPSFVANVFLLAPQTVSVTASIQQQAHTYITASTAHNHFLATCFEGPHSRYVFAETSSEHYC